MQPEKTPSRLFSLVMPVLALMCSMTLVLAPAGQSYFNLKHTAQSLSGSGNRSASILIGSANFQMILPVEKIPMFALNTAAMREQGFITFLNAPGYIVYAILAGATGHSAHWSPDGILSALWLAIMMPICAVPAWWFVGRGMDGFFRRRRLGLTDLIVSLLLLLGSATISAGLWFGMTAEERGGDEMSAWFVAGFAWWTGLFAIPMGVWLYQRTRGFRRP